jgi:hypothetical protein
MGKPRYLDDIAYAMHLEFAARRSSALHWITYSLLGQTIGGSRCVGLPPNEWFTLHNEPFITYCVGGAFLRVPIAKLLGRAWNGDNEFLISSAF